MFAGSLQPTESLFADNREHFFNSIGQMQTFPDAPQRNHHVG
jgi:hypothetical protein